MFASYLSTPWARVWWVGAPLDRQWGVGGCGYSVQWSGVVEQKLAARQEAGRSKFGCLNFFSQVCWLQAPFRVAEPLEAKLLKCNSRLTWKKMMMMFLARKVAKKEAKKDTQVFIFHLRGLQRTWHKKIRFFFKIICFKERERDITRQDCYYEKKNYWNNKSEYYSTTMSCLDIWLNIIRCIKWKY